jgi:hypothetical protein
MFQRNELWIGLFVGILLPAVCFTMLYQIFLLLEARGAASGDGLAINFRERTLALIAIVTNLWPMRIYRKRRWEALVWIWRYGPGLF